MSAERQQRSVCKSGSKQNDSTYLKGYFDADYTKSTKMSLPLDVSKTVPAHLLSIAMKQATSLRNLPETNENYLLSVTFPDREDLVLFIDKKSFLLNKIESLAYHGSLGNQVISLHYSHYEDVQGLKIPKQTIYSTGNSIDRTLTLSNVQLYVPLDSAKLRTQWLPQTVQKALGRPVTKKEHIQTEKIAPNLHLLKIASRNNKILVLEMQDGIALFEAPLDRDLNLEILDKVTSLFPSKPLTHLFLTHHHPEHAGGLIAYSAQNIKIVTTAGNEQFFRSLLTASHALSGKSERVAQSYGFEFVPKGGVKRFSSDVVAYEIGASTGHTEEHLLYYFPKEKILWVGDLVHFNKEGVPSGIGKRSKSLYDLVLLHNLNVERIYVSWPLHGQKDHGTFEELKSVFEQACKDATPRLRAGSTPSFLPPFLPLKS